MNYIQAVFISSTTLFHSNRLPHTFRLTSDDFFSSFKEQENLIDVFKRNTNLSGSISFCYIDGNHAYEFAKKDFENADKCLLVNGFILLDDSCGMDLLMEVLS